MMEVEARQTAGRLEMPGKAVEILTGRLARRLKQHKGFHSRPPKIETSLKTVTSLNKEANLEVAKRTK